MNLQLCAKVFEDVEQMRKVTPRATTFEVRELASVNRKSRCDFKLGLPPERSELGNDGTELTRGKDLAVLPRR